MKLRTLALLLPVTLQLACATGSATPDAAAPADAQTATDSAATDSAATDAPPLEAATADSAAAPDASTVDASSALPVINACTADVYVDMSTGTPTDRMIMPTRSGGLDMPCMTINAGQGVMFMWSFAASPLSPGRAAGHESDPAGTTPNPIQMHSTGTTYTVTFPTPGIYPYFVPSRPMMMGAIQVQ